MEPLVSDHVLINGFRIAYGIHGEGDPVVLLHGTPSSSLIWRHIVPFLTAAGYKVHVFDLLGFGLSERPWDSSIDTSISGQVFILEGLLDYWCLDRVHLISHDIGGGIAQRFGIFSPARVRTLTLIDTVSFDSYPSARTKQQMRDGLEVLIKRSDRDHRAHFREWLLSAVENKRQFSESVLETYLDYISGAIGQGSFFMHQVRHYDPKHTLEISDRLHELGVFPVQLIWGADDIWQVVDWAHRLNAVIPGSELAIIEECGHFSLEDQPVKISDILVRFLHRNR